MTHKLQNYTKEILTLLRKLWDPKQISQPEGLRTPREFSLEASEIWLQNFHRTRETDLEYMFVCTNKVQNFVHTRSQEIGAVSPQETEPDFPVSVQESLVEAWVDSGLLRGPGTEYNSVCTSPFEGHHYHIYPYHSLPQAKTRERTQPRPPTELH